MGNKGAGLKDLKQLMRKLRKAGVELELTGGTHWRATHPDKPGVKLTFASTPSDWRGLKNMKAAFKRRMGIEL